MLQFVAVLQVLFSVGGLGFTPMSHGGQHIVERNLTRLTVVIGILFTITSVSLYYLL